METKTGSKTAVTISLPRLIFADTNSLPEQIVHVESELEEVKKALLSESIDRVAEELADLIVSAMTALNIIEWDNNLKIDDVFKYVHAKNKARGYEI